MSRSIWPVGRDLIYTSSDILYSIKQGRQFRYNVTMRRVRVATCREKAISIKYYESVSNIVSCMHRTVSILSSLSCLAVQGFSRYLISYTIFGEKLLTMKVCSDFL
jgi:hypothetical protein